MGAALVAYVDRQTRSIELDPAVRPGARLDGDGEALLLHTTSAGHCEETAAYLATVLRASGWRVSVRQFEHLGPIANAPRGPGLLQQHTEARLLREIGNADPTRPPIPPPTTPPAAPRRRGRQRYYVCRVCAHRTNTRGVQSHRLNIGHDDWQAIYVEPDGTVTPAQAQARAPEAPGEPSSASE